MRKKNRDFCLFIVSIVYASLFITPLKSQANDQIDFSLQNIIDGTTFNASDHHGKKMIVVFGSMYCKPCVALIPLLNKIHEQKNSTGIVVAGIDIDYTTDREKIEKFTAQHNIKFPFLIDNNNIARKYKVFLLPTILFVDCTGNIENKSALGSRSYKFLEKEYEKLKTKSCCR